jgi:hypothetical protein
MNHRPTPHPGPVGHGLAGQPGAIVAAQHGRVAAPGGDAVQFVEEVPPVLERSTRPPRHPRVCSSTMDTTVTGLPSVVASKGRSTAHTRLGASAFGGSGVVLVPSRVRRRFWGTRRPSSRHRRWILLWLTCQPSSSGVVVGVAEPAPRMILGPRWSPVPQRGVRIGWCRRRGRPWLGGSVLPGHAAGEPFTHAHHADGVRDTPPAGVPG